LWFLFGVAVTFACALVLVVVLRVTCPWVASGSWKLLVFVGFVLTIEQGGLVAMSIAELPRQQSRRPRGSVPKGAP
jgi:hypothetical protein